MIYGISSKKNEPKILSKFWLTFVISILLLITVIFVVIYSGVQQETLSRAYQTEWENCDSFSNMITVVSDTAEDLLQQLYDNPRIRTLIYVDPFENLENINAMMQFREYVEASWVVDSAYIYSATREIVVHISKENGGINARVSEADAFHDVEFLNQLMEYRAIDAAPIMRTMQKSSTIQSQQVLTYCLPVQNHSDRFDGIYVINIRAEQLFKLLNDITDADYRQILIADDVGQYYSSDTSLLDEQQQMQLLSCIQETSLTQGQSVADGMSDAVLYTWCQPEDLPFTVVSCISEKNAVEYLRQLKIWIIGFYVSVAVIFFVMLVLIRNKFQNEYKSWQSNYKKATKRYVDNYVLIKDAILRRFLNAQEEESSLEKKFTDNNISISTYNGYSLLLLELKMQADIGRKQNIKFQAVREMLMDITLGIIGKDYRCEFVSVLQNRLLLMCECTDIEKIKMLFDGLQMELEEGAGWRINGVYAVDIPTLSTLPEVYQRILNYWPMLYFWNPNTIVNIQDIIARKETEKESEKFGRVLVGYLQNQRYEEARTATKEFFSQWYETPDRKVKTLHYLTNKMQKYVEAMETTYAVSTNLDMYMFEQDVSQCECASLVEGLFLDLIDDLNVVFADVGKRKTQVESVLSVIHEDYQNPELSVEYLAERIGVSASYLQQVFKETTGTAVAKYLRNLRFAKAKELLVETDLPVSDVGKKCGFENANYFYTAFKKQFDITPGDYRIQKRIDGK